MPYLPIEDHGIVGNMRTVALVGINGSIDWFCYPHFDSPSVFGAILDDQQGGHFQIAPVNGTDSVTCKQFYWPDTNVLVTRFLSADGVGEINDFMPVGPNLNQNGDRGRLIRSVSVIRGTLRFRMVCRPAFDYARHTHELTIDARGAVFNSSDLRLGLAATVPLSADPNSNAAVAEFTLNEGETAVFVLHEVPSGAGCGPVIGPHEAQHLFEATVGYWRRWLSQCTYTGRWREMMLRSALALKLMTFEPTGAIVAAPTASLPEGIGGERNWDYRYTWLRDAGFTVYALIRLGFTGEATAFMDWLDERLHEQDPDEPLQPLYGIDGRHKITEEALSHLSGYRGSRPVRIGNGAYNQFQLDIYGAVMDAVYLSNKYGQFVSYDLRTKLRRVTDWVADNWRRTDLGIWEVRSDPQPFVYSKLMCWVALDRGLRLADKRSFPAPRVRWQTIRDEIYEQVMTHGYNRARHAFVQHYHTDALDAANLIMPLVFFVGANDPMMRNTIEATMQSADRGGLMSGGMVYRYNLAHSVDGLSGEEGTFDMCTFWLVEALTRAGQIDRARLIFERMLGYANHVGLYAEQTGPSGEALGNFPQAFTHLGLISAAFNLNRALGG
ncbi:MAG: glycoside hydrolase family 15 protein [Chloroflexi bacterium]|nr:glycoside hydrolase family 15 protein [Chloroflexota bacterium]